jgi:hypothetical protein
MTVHEPEKDELPDVMTCDRCGAETRMIGIEPHPTVESADLHTYVCELCDAMKTKIEPRRS